jgi:hypothetical protein
MLNSAGTFAEGTVVDPDQGRGEFDVLELEVYGYGLKQSKKLL